jgi:hypothetical protein
MRTTVSSGERLRSLAIGVERIFPVRNGSQWFTTVRNGSPPLDYNKELKKILIFDQNKSKNKIFITYFYFKIKKIYA